MKFNYKSDYKKFKPNSKVRITFMDGKNEITKKVRIISIGEKAISFEDKETVYECTPSEIKNIKESRKIFITYFIWIILYFILTRYICFLVDLFVWHFFHGMFILVLFIPPFLFIIPILLMLMFVFPAWLLSTKIALYLIQKVVNFIDFIWLKCLEFIKEK